MSANLNRWLVIGAGIVVIVVTLLVSSRQPGLEVGPGKPGAPKAGSYLFCFWNVENLFDDRDDGRKTKGDAEFDDYFGGDPEALHHKLKHLTDVLMPLNDGRGPDLLAVCEVESEKAAQLLADAMNKRLGKEEFSVVFEQLKGVGRHIAPALITRVPVVPDRTDVWGKRKRILKTVIRGGDGHELMVVVSHWTSRVTDHAEDGEARAGYGDTIYGEFAGAYLAARKEGRILDFLVCGDFNDNPDDASVTDHLHAIGDLARVKASKGDPLLFDLVAKLYAEGQATHYYGAKKYVFDHVCVSPGMLDDVGWSCDVDSVRVVTSFADKKGRPNRFGGKNDKRPFDARGASDHFPVTVRLQVR